MMGPRSQSEIDHATHYSVSKLLPRDRRPQRTYILKGGRWQLAYAQSRFLVSRSHSVLSPQRRNLCPLLP